MAKQSNPKKEEIKKETIQEEKKPRGKQKKSEQEEDLLKSITLPDTKIFAETLLDKLEKVEPLPPSKEVTEEVKSNEGPGSLVDFVKKVDETIIDQLKEIASKEKEIEDTVPSQDLNNSDNEYAIGVDTVNNNEDISKITVFKKDECGEIIKIALVENSSESFDNTVEKLSEFYSSEPISETKEIKLSKIAQSYKKYIEYIKTTPEAFIAKYPKHKFIDAVKEILEWQTKTGGV